MQRKFAAGFSDKRGDGVAGKTLLAKDLSANDFQPLIEERGGVMHCQKCELHCRGCRARRQYAGSLFLKMKNGGHNHPPLFHHIAILSASSSWLNRPRG